MNNKNFRKTLKQIKRYAGVFAKGFSRMLYGTLLAILYVTAIMGFILVAADGGYTAVFDFIAACATLAVAVFNTYVWGKIGGVKK